MKLTNWLKSRLFRSQKARRLKPNSHRPRQLERLEDRSLLAVLTVDDDMVCAGAAFSTIQAAIDASSAGDTVQVCAGTYNESPNVSKSLTLNGANAGISAGVGGGVRGDESIVNGGFIVQANDTTVDGFQIVGGANFPGEEGVGVFFVGGTSGHQIENNIITGDGTGRGVLSTFGADNDNITIQGNDIGNWTSGIFNQGNTNVDVLNNVIHDNLAGVANDFVDDVLIQGNDFNNNGEAVGAFESTDVVVKGNNLDGNTTGVNNYGGESIDARQNWWGSPAGPEPGYNSGDVDDSLSLLDEAFSGNTLVFTGPDGVSLVVNQATGQYTFIDDDGVSYTGTGARVQNGLLKIHDQSSTGKIDVKGAADGSIGISLKGKGKPRTFTLQAS